MTTSDFPSVATTESINDYHKLSKTNAAALSDAWLEKISEYQLRTIGPLEGNTKPYSVILFSVSTEDDYCS